MTLSEIFTIQNLAHLLDIAVVWFVVYKVGTWVSGTRAMQLVRGVFIILIIRLIAWYLGLDTVAWILDQVISWGPIALVVLFQTELRQALERLGNGVSIFKSKDDLPAELTVIGALDQAIPYLSRRKIGALIAIERSTSLQEIIDTGIEIDAEVSSALLINTFIPNTPLHDGAVVIRNDRIASATSYLPLSENVTTSKELGTRHRAALGLSEETDAVVIVVSEETGEVSIAHEGYLNRHLKPEEYDEYLRSHLLPSKRESKNSWFSKSDSKEENNG
ncbi:MAG: diadenylate cyclase CdaA [Lactobacillaceae bacterium]|jgi:diadenylate cyclase|nr:diadenylate cyclase CdaA [Lactobacillaceae bacterium]